MNEHVKRLLAKLNQAPKAARFAAGGRIPPADPDIVPVRLSPGYAYIDGEHWVIDGDDVLTFDEAVERGLIGRSEP